MIKTELPENWTKFLHENGKIYYYNGIENLKTKKHPLLKKFRVYYHNVLL